jgi:hypothetical protein
MELISEQDWMLILREYVFGFGKSKSVSGELKELQALEGVLSKFKKDVRASQMLLGS